MMKLAPLALAAILASTALASAQYSGGGGSGYGGGPRDGGAGTGYGGGGRSGGAVVIEEDDRRDRRGGRDWDRGRDYGQGRETVIIRTLAPEYRFVEERGRRCRIVITRKQRANGTIVRTERREC